MRNQGWKKMNISDIIFEGEGGGGQESAEED